MKFFTFLLFTLSCFLLVQLPAQTDDQLDLGIDIDTPERMPMPNAWYLTGGAMFFGSDVAGVKLSGWSIGLGHQSSLSDNTFLRLGLLYGVDTDVDDTYISNKDKGLNDVLQGMGYESFVRNYSTSVIGFQAKLGWDFINTYAANGKKKFSVYALGGVDLLYYTVKYDARDENGSLYDFSAINFEADDVEEQVEDLLDGEYETEAPDAGQIGIGLNLGLGLRYQASDGFGLGLEHQTGLTFTDKLDGYVSSDQNDSVNHTRLFLYFSF